MGGERRRYVRDKRKSFISHHPVYMYVYTLLSSIYAAITRWELAGVLHPSLKFRNIFPFFLKKKSRCIKVAIADHRKVIRMFQAFHKCFFFLCVFLFNFNVSFPRVLISFLSGMLGIYWASCYFLSFGHVSRPGQAAGAHLFFQFTHFGMCT
jgi:hypothetical protein